MNLKCLSCCVEAKQAGELPRLIEFQDAITMVPVWKENVLPGGQKIIMCVPELVCYEHLVVLSALAL